ncbi:MAG: (Na+)-NQR maturation NqrM [Pseudomonadales bacterium]
MATLIITFVVFLLIVGAMAVGVMMGRKPIAGSCGGMAALGMTSDCEICGGDRSKCDSEKPISSTNKASFYNAAD